VSHMHVNGVDACQWCLSFARGPVWVCVCVDFSKFECVCVNACESVCFTCVCGQ